MPKLIGNNKYKVPNTIKTVDLPASTSAPAEIDCSDNKVVNVEIWVNGDFYMAFGDDATEGATNVGADATRLTLKSGYKSQDVILGTDKKIYIKAQGSAVSGGLSYQLNEV